MKKKTELIFTALTALVLALTMSFTAVAWFCFRQESGSAGFLTGDIDPVALHIARVRHGETEAERFWTACEPKSFGMSAPEKASAYYDIQLSELSFGSIDNLSFLRPENVIYLRISIDKNDGNTVVFNVGNYDIDGYFFSIYRNVYSEDGKNVLGQELVEADTVINDKKTPAVMGSELIDSFKEVQVPAAEGDEAIYYLQYSYAFSLEKYENAADIAAAEIPAAEGESPALDFGDTLYDFSSDYTDQSAEISLAYDGYEELLQDEYYLYIKLMPNLDAFSESIDFMFEIMPCAVLFNVGIEIELYHKEDVIP